MNRVFVIAWISCAVIVASTDLNAAAPADQILPNTTKGFVSITDVADFQERWANMQLGKLAADPVMKPFADDLQRQIRDKIVNSRFNMQISWEDLAAACGGELCIASIQPDNDPEKHAAILIVDITGRQEQAQVVLKDISEQLQEKGAQRSAKEAEGQQLVIHEIPREKGQIEAGRVIQFVADDMLVICNNEAASIDVLRRIRSQERADSLVTVPAFGAVMARVSKDAGSDLPQVRWYVDPFDYAQVVRVASGGRKKRGKDILNILRSQGFDAVQAVGGHVHMATGSYEVLHRTMVYAPPVKSAGSERYRLAARMLDFPNSSTWNLPQWLPRELSSVTNFRWKTQEAFRYSETLVDAIAGSEGFFEDLLASIKDDPNGPQIDVRKDFVKYLGEQVTVMSDHEYPITPKSEQMLIAIQLTDPEKVKKTLAKALDNDPDARGVDLDSHRIWEIIDNEDESAPDLGLELEGIDPIGDPIIEEEPEEEMILRNSAVTVAYGQLMVATHIDCLRRILEARGDTDQLTKCEDFHLVEKHLREIGAGDDCARFFTRTDEAYRPTYELIRQGRMPESESMLGKLLNQVLGPDDEGMLRSQQIDGSQLPEFQTVRRYLGPAGAFVRTEEDGWFATGCLLDKQAAFVDGITKPAITAQNDDKNDDTTR